MRSVLGNAVFAASVLCLFCAALLVAVGFELSSPGLYAAANSLLVAAALLGLVRYLVGAVVVCTEADTDGVEGLELEVTRGDDLVRALLRLHTVAANLSPKQPTHPQVTRPSAVPETTGTDATGLGKRLCDGLDTSSAVGWTLAELRRGLVTDWGEDGAPNPGGTRTGWSE
eukprot:Hpha_TRINITY_DN19660_c0_g1::TRINITY_DN19660_c0_g1_i1::g.186164::m.186164